MSVTIPTRHWSENGPTDGYVYLATRGRTDYSVKIGSTRTTPAHRLAQTPRSKRGTFLIACATTAARELEYLLQLKYTQAGKSLGDREHFNLTLYDVVELALWFNGATFMTPDQIPHVMTFVNQDGQPLNTLEEMAILIGNAALETSLADYMRIRKADELRGQHRRQLIEQWAERTARRWRVELETFNILLRQGRLVDQLQRVHEHIDQGRRPPIIPVPAHLRVYLETSPESWHHLDRALDSLEAAGDELLTDLG